MNESQKIAELELRTARAEEARARSQTYRLLANVFAKEPTSDFLRRLGSSPLAQRFKHSNLPTGEIKNNALVEKQVEELACEYARLFIGPGNHLAPQESIWRGEKRLWGDVTVKVNLLYRECGFVLDPSYKDMPDHISAELEFLAQACEVEAKRWSFEEWEPLKNVLETASWFLEEHLVKWGFPFLDQVQDTARGSYYQEWSRFSKEFLAQEQSHIRQSLDHVNILFKAVESK